MTINADPNGMLCGNTTGLIIGAFYDVYNELRWGFLEKVYTSSLAVEFQRRGLMYVPEYPLEVNYKGIVVGVYKPDFIVAGEVVVEIKAVRELGDPDRRQLLHYLRATDMEVGLLLNFGPEATFHRMVHARKPRSAEKS
jgi:GxxExxY protein